MVGHHRKQGRREQSRRPSASWCYSTIATADSKLACLARFAISAISIASVHRYRVGLLFDTAVPLELRTCCSCSPLRLLTTLLAGSAARYWIFSMRSLLLMPALLAVMATAHAASPNINVGAMYEYLEPGRSMLLKRVRNSGDATAFVRVEITEVVYDSAGKPIEQPLPPEQALTLEGTAAHLLASPARLIVPASGQQAARLLYRGDRSRERYYRLRFVPVLPASEEFALTEAESEDYRKQLSAGVNVLTGYGVFVIVHPAQATYRVHHQESSDSYLLRNDGNSTVIVEDLVHCQGSGKAEQCSPPRKVHLLPGRSQRFEKLVGHAQRFQLVEGDTRRSVHFNR